MALCLCPVPNTFFDTLHRDDREWIVRYLVDAAESVDGPRSAKWRGSLWGSELSLLLDVQSTFRNDLGYLFPKLDIGGCREMYSVRLLVAEYDEVELNALRGIGGGLSEVSIMGAAAIVHRNLLRYCPGVRVLHLGTRDLCTEI